MGPIPAEDMEKWLLHGVPPKQMGRAIHRPVLEATSADPASLLVCALLPGELERNMKPGASDVLQAPTLHCTAALAHPACPPSWGPRIASGTPHIISMMPVVISCHICLSCCRPECLCAPQATCVWPQHGPGLLLRHKRCEHRMFKRCLHTLVDSDPTVILCRRCHHHALLRTATFACSAAHPTQPCAWSKWGSGFHGRRPGGQQAPRLHVNPGQAEAE